MAPRINLTPELSQQIIDQYQAGVPVRLITEETGISDASIHRLLVAKGVQGVRVRKKNTKFTPEVEQAMKADYMDGQSLTQVGKKYGCAFETVYRILLRNDTPMRPSGGRFASFADDQIKEMLEAWRGGESQQSIAKRLGTTQNQVSRLLRMRGIPAEETRASGPRSSQWKGGRIQAHGYVFINVPSTDPFASMRNSTGYVLEHRLVMARSLGRPLTKGETVHHIDGDSLNNSLSNLQLRQGKHGRGAVLKCGDCGSSNVVAAHID